MLRVISDTASRQQPYLAQRAPAAISSDLNPFPVTVIIQGLPENVQWIADALECVVPGAISWHDCAQPLAAGLIAIMGVGRREGDTPAIG
ncbi:MAG: hypothetical protein EOO77_21900 [Oxalobacteraceae bacterium]|nr:MAG: hypothetical protein EOO77_21900 [Oxalobacteraceae bacterium]